MAPREIPGCLTDATSSDGLWTLLKRDPERAFNQLRGLSARRALQPDLTIGRWLRDGADGSLLPDHPGDRAFVPRRAAAASWMPYVARLRLAEMDEGSLLQVVHARLAKDKPVSKDNWTKHCTWLRTWISQGQAAIRAPRLVDDCWSVIPRAKGMKSERAPVRLVEVHRVLVGCVPKVDLGLAIGFALGSGLTVAEIVALRHGDLDLVAGTVHVRQGSRRGVDGSDCARVAGMPPWLVDLYRLVFPSMQVGDAWLFPDPSRPGAHVTRLDGRLRRVAEKVGDLDITMEGIRRVHQGILRAASASRAATRGRVAGSDGTLRRTRTQETFQAEHTAVTRAWRWLMSPPYDPVYVPRRAPKECAPLQPELEAARARVKARIKRPISIQAMRTLPGSCLSGPQRDTLRRDPPVPLAVELLRADMSLDGPRLAQRTRELAERDLKIARLEVALEEAHDARRNDRATYGEYADMMRVDRDVERSKTWEAFQAGAVSAVIVSQFAKVAQRDETYGPKIRSYLELIGATARPKDDPSSS